MRGRFRRRCREYYFPNAFDISQNLVIPKAEDAATMVDEPLISNRVPRVRSMLTAVDFDDEPSFSANKIDDVRTDWLLPDELEATQCARAEVLPQPLLRESRVFSQSSGRGCLRYLCAAHAAKPPHPSLSPHAGRGCHSTAPRSAALPAPAGAAPPRKTPSPARTTTPAPAGPTASGAAGRSATSGSARGRDRP